MSKRSHTQRQRPRGRQTDIHSLHKCSEANSSKQRKWHTRQHASIGMQTNTLQQKQTNRQAKTAHADTYRKTRTDGPRHRPTTLQADH